MSTQVDFNFTATLRTANGTSSSRLLRKQSLVPATVYGGDKANPVSISIKKNELVKKFMHQEVFTNILSLDIDGKKEKVIIKAIERHPFKPEIIHLDFQRVSSKTRITLSVPLNFIGEEVAPGVKQGGGQISHQLTSVEVNCLPDSLPQVIDVDLSNLNLNESIHLSDLKLPAGVQIVELTHGADHDQVVCSINATKEAVEEESEAPVTAEVPATTQKKSEE